MAARVMHFPSALVILVVVLLVLYVMLMIFFLLAPCASALRVLLDICDTFASSHGLVFNAAKTQLICFRHAILEHTRSNTFPPEIIFNGSTLRFVEEVSHLGHILAYNLDDKQDIIRAIKELNRKANSSLDPFIKCFLLKSYCLSLYGSPLWSLSSPSLRSIEVALNKLLRKVWNLPYNSHRSIVHCTSHIPTVSHLVFVLFINVICILFFLCSSSFCFYSLHSVYLHIHWLQLHTRSRTLCNLFYI